MKGTQNSATSSSMVTMKDEGGVKIVGKVKRSTSGTTRQLKTLDTFEFLWETTLQLEPGKKVITSREYVIDVGTKHESRWRIELDPNYVDQLGFRYLFVYLVLVKTYKADAVKSVIFNVILPTSPNFQGCHYAKTAGLAKFSKEKLARGFEKFIELYKLGSAANPKSMEKLRVVILFSDLKDVPEPEKKANFADLAFLSISLHKTKLQLNSFVNFEKTPIRVDLKRLSYYTSFFDKYLYKNRGSNYAQDLSTRFSHKTLLMKIIEFCHTGEVQMPKKLEGLCNLLKASIQVEIPQFINECQAEILKRLAVDNFMKVVDLSRDGFLGAKVAYPSIYKYMLKNIRELEMDHYYSVNYSDYKEFYQKVVLFCEKEGDDVTEYERSKTGPTDDWTIFYINPPDVQLNI